VNFLQLVLLDEAFAQLAYLGVNIWAALADQPAMDAVLATVSIISVDCAETYPGLQTFAAWAGVAASIAVRAMAAAPALIP